MSTFALLIILFGIGLPVCFGQFPRNDTFIDCGHAVGLYHTKDLLYAGFISQVQSNSAELPGHPSQKCLQDLMDAQSKVVYAVIGATEEDLYAYFQVYRAPFLPHRVWREEVAKRRYPGRLTVIVRLGSQLEIRTWDGTKSQSTRMDKLLSDVVESDIPDKIPIGSLRHISASFSPIERIEKENDGWSWEAVGIHVYVVNDEIGSAFGKEVYGAIRRFMPTGELMLFMSTASCFRGSGSFPYLDVMASESTRCLSTPSYGSREMVCYGSLKNGAVNCTESR